MTLKAGVVGWPAKHSLSPTIHRAWLKAAGIDGTYDIFEREDFAVFLTQARELGLCGVNVTVPFKEQALAAANEASKDALTAGAANVLLFAADNALLARNTDGLGVLEALKPALGTLENRVVVILGAGGAAGGAIMALHSQAGTTIRIVNRTLDRARATAAGFGDRVSAFGWDQMAKALSGADAVINATTRGLNGDNPLVIDFAGLRSGAPVMDMVYKPRDTAFLQAARVAGHPTVDGLDMLIGQARPSFEMFYGQWPDESVDVRALCLAEIARRGG